MNKALFLDRDGVINTDKNHVHLIADVDFIEGIFPLASAAHKAGYKLIVITNQGGIARGKFTEEQFQTLMSWMHEQFAINNAPLTAVYHCPHHPEHGERTICECRKPKPGMLLQAASEHDIDLSRSLMVGDKQSDMQAAKAAGIPIRIFIPGWEDASPPEATQTVVRLAEVLPFLTA